MRIERGGCSRLIAMGTEQQRAKHGPEGNSPVTPGHAHCHPVTHAPLHTHHTPQLLETILCMYVATITKVYAVLHLTIK